MNTLKTLTIIFNIFIIVGAAHGGAPLALFEFLSLREVFSGDFQFNFSGSYDERIMTAGVISLIGQTILVCSFLVDEKVKSILSIFGCLILLAATYILTKDAWGMNISIFSLDIFSLFLSLPFIGAALMLLTKEIKGLKKIRV